MHICTYYIYIYTYIYIYIDGVIWLIWYLLRLPLRPLAPPCSFESDLHDTSSTRASRGRKFQSAGKYKSKQRILICRFSATHIVKHTCRVTDVLGLWGHEFQSNSHREARTVYIQSEKPLAQDVSFAAFPWQK